jgi:hypothetical protein
MLHLAHMVRVLDCRPEQRAGLFWRQSTPSANQYRYGAFLRLVASQHTNCRSTARPVAQEAVAHWAAAGLGAPQLATLNAVQYQISTLGDGVLGLTSLVGQVVTLDATAAAYGWYVDPNSPDDTAFGNPVAPAEYQASAASAALGRMDLLTVVEHELGHVLGLSDLDPQAVPHDLMTLTLGTGVRRIAAPTDVMAVGGQASNTDSGAPTGNLATLPSEKNGGGSLQPIPVGAGDTALISSIPLTTTTGTDRNGALQDGPLARNQGPVASVFDPTLMAGLPLLVTNGTLAGAVTWNQLTVAASGPALPPAPVAPVDGAFGAATVPGSAGDGLAVQTPGQRPAVDVSALDRVFGSTDVGKDDSADLG